MAIALYGCTHALFGGQCLCPVGRWVVLSCSTELTHMCQSSSNITEIVFSSARLSWGQAQVIRETTYMYTCTFIIYVLVKAVMLF